MIIKIRLNRHLFMRGTVVVQFEEDEHVKGAKK